MDLTVAIPENMPMMKAIIRLDITDSLNYKWLYTWGQAMDYIAMFSGSGLKHVAIRQADGCIQVDIF